MEHCDNCKYYDKDDGQCRRRAPVVILEKAAEYGHGEVGYCYDSSFPSVADNDWCGEYEAKKDVTR